MKNRSVKQTRKTRKVMHSRKPLAGTLSDNALYVIALACRLKKLLGPASLSHFLATGETVIIVS